ncbi:MAG TPA: MDR family MFS transporter [Desulfitobacteriaceae bacterium]|nr:MDR family MFS transporter [Desulfitobacteriaceae bacterium]
MEARAAEEKFVNRDIDGKTYNRNLFVITMLIGTFICSLCSTFMTTALPKIMNSFSISASTGQWLTTGYMLVSASMVPLTAVFMEKILTKKLVMFAMLLFGIGTVICAFSLSFAFLLLGRIIQAIGQGIMMPLIGAVFMMIFPAEKKGTAMGLIGLTAFVAPAVGPLIAGAVIDRWTWPYMFYILIPFVVLDSILVFLFVENVMELKNPKIEVLSIILSTIGLGALLFGFSSAGNRGWSDPVVMISIVMGLIVFSLFVWRQLTMEKPMLELRIFKTKAFALGTIIGCISNIPYIGVTIILPLFIQSVLGKPALTSSLVLLPGALTMAVMTLVAGRLYDRYGVKRLAIPGLILLAVSTLPFADLHINTSLILIALLHAVRLVGIALVVLPVQTICLANLPHKLLPHGSAVLNLTTTGFGSIGVAVLITIMSNVTASHAPAKALAQTDAALYKSEMLHAVISGMNTTFMVMIALTVVSLVIILFLKEKKQKNTQFKMLVSGRNGIFKG